MNGLHYSKFTGTDCSTVVFPKLCFISYHGECRGPMAAAVYNHLAGKRGLSWHAVSAGISVTDREISRGAINALESRGIAALPDTPLGCVPFEVTDVMLGGCELAVCVCRTCASELAAKFPAYAHKTVTLSRDISAVSGDDPAAYRRCLDELIAVLRKDFDL